MSYRRSRARRKRLRKLHNETRHHYGSGAWYDDRRKCFKKYSVSDSFTGMKELKRLTNKRARKMDDLPNGSAYKKGFDLWWEVF